MRRSISDPYSAVLRRFNRGGIRYVVVGMSGINYYARNPSEMFSTLDYDLFLDPSVENLERAVGALRDLGFGLGTADGALKEKDLRRIVRDRRTIVATTPEGMMIELLLEISGYPFSEMERDAATFTVGGVPVKVGRLRKLLRSKKLAGRPKDRRFLQRYQDLLEE